jgi:hypothetical protein
MRVCSVAGEQRHASYVQAQPAWLRNTRLFWRARAR